VSQRTADGFRQFVYQGPDMLKLQLERDESEETVAHYTMGAGLEAMRREAESSSNHSNHRRPRARPLGPTLALTGADEARIAEGDRDTYRHDAWGVLLASTGSTVNPHTYVGQQRYYRMPNASMYHLGFRDYAQGLGRFTTVDPLSRITSVRQQVLQLIRPSSGVQMRVPPLSWLPPWGVAKYGYGLNQPASFTDAGGLFPILGVCIVVVIGALVFTGCGNSEEEAQEDATDNTRTGLQDLIRDRFKEVVQQLEECPHKTPDIGPWLDPLLLVIDSPEAKKEAESRCKAGVDEITDAIRLNPENPNYDAMYHGCFDCCKALLSAVLNNEQGVNTACDHACNQIA